jgi:two-component system LytT family response regulator
MKAIIIDDEPLSVGLISLYLQQDFPDLLIAGSAFSVEQGQKLIEITRPDLVFLDVQLGAKTGFDLLEGIENIDFQVVFITAFSEYAVRAFRFRVADYLLKPVDRAELNEAVQRAKQALPELGQGIVRTLRIPSSRGTIFVPIRDVVRLTAKGSYSEITLRGGITHLCSGNLSHFEEHLSESCFLRIGRSFLINLNYLSKLEAPLKAVIKMEDGFCIPIPRRQKRQIVERLSPYTK